MRSTSWIGIMRAVLGRCAYILCLIHSVWSQGPFQITFSSNPLYSGDPVTLTVSYGSGNLVFVSVDAFDGSLKKGSLSYISSPVSSSGVGVFAGQTFTGWQTHPPSATSISVTLTATPSLELNYNCTAKVFTGGSLVDGTCEPAFLQVRGRFQITFSSNPLYSGDSVTLTVSYGSGVLALVSVDAFDGSLKKGSLSYISSPANSSGVGVFAGQTFTGWQTHPNTATNISVTLTATPSLEHNYTCTAKVFNGGSLVDGTCEPASLEVRGCLKFEPTTRLSIVPQALRSEMVTLGWCRFQNRDNLLSVTVCPSTPNFQPSPVTFLDSDNGTVVCESRNGKPAALVSLTASDVHGATLTTGNFSDSAALVLPSPLSNWNNATLTCRVTNHNCINMSVTTHVLIRFNTSVPDLVCTNESNVVLNCSKHIWSYPGFVYKWTIPVEANVTGRLDLESFTVPQGQFGSFNCTATNNYSMASVVIVFTVSNICHPTTTPIFSPGSPPCGQCWIIGLVLGIIAVVIIAVVLGVLRKRGLLLKRFFGGTSASASAKRHSELFVTHQSVIANATPQSGDQNYEAFHAQLNDKDTYAQLTREDNERRSCAYENVETPKHSL